MANPEYLARLKEAEEKGKEGIQEWNRERMSVGVRPDLRGAELRKASLRKASLREADLREADLRRADLREADLRIANLSGADLSEADLRGADLHIASLSGANLSIANLSRADLREADLREADLRRANLRGADLSIANLREADLREADLSEADLRRANLSGADLSGANLRGDRLLFTNFGETNLKSAVGLESCVHFGRSFLDYFTLAQSWPLPIPFLRGCGLPDNYIDYLPSLLNQAIQFYSCFISYSMKDEDFANRLYADLQNKGVRCWFAPHDIQGGKKIHEQIDEAIRLHDKLLLILSPASMASKWVKTEIANARAREEQQKRQMLFPLTIAPYDSIKQWKCFDADTGIDSAREIREYFVPDFSNWKEHDSYQKAFDRLLKDLKSTATTGHEAER
jgi:uncharacterized protein YjbI with pentapeptide repeats